MSETTEKITLKSTVVDTVEFCVHCNHKYVDHPVLEGYCAHCENEKAVEIFEKRAYVTPEIACMLEWVPKSKESDDDIELPF